jgi:nucleotide-binding universal stress UspA family protein
MKMPFELQDVTSGCGLSRMRIDPTGCERAPRQGPAAADRCSAPQTFRSVVLALRSGDRPIVALQHACALAQSLAAELHVLAILPSRRRFPGFMADLDLVRAARRVERCLRAAREVRSWCDDLLDQPLPVGHLRIQVGNFVEQVVNYVEALDRAFIVLPPSTEQLGHTATTLARATSRPVLVARPMASRPVLLAATDLERDDAWVVRRAAELGGQLGAFVLAMHNVSGLSVPVSASSGAAVEGIAIAIEAEGREPRLARARKRLADFSTVLTEDPNPVDAILEQARLHEVYTIVVGTRSRSWLERLVEPGVAGKVVDRSERSVLVTPGPG